MAYGIAREVTTSASPERVHAVLADAASEAHWNTLVTRARRSFGDGGEGTIFTMRMKFLLGEEKVRLTLERATLPWVRLGGSGEHVDISQTFTVREIPEGSTVSIATVYTFHGALRRVQRVIEPRLDKAWDASCPRLQRHLDLHAGS